MRGQLIACCSVLACFPSSAPGVGGSRGQVGVGHALEEARGGVVNRCNTGGVGVGSPVCGFDGAGGRIRIMLVCLS